VGALAGNTFREAVRNKLLYNLLLFAMLMIGSSVVIADLHLGHAERIYLDFGLSAIALFGTLIAIFVGINLVYRDLEIAIMGGCFLGLVLVQDSAVTSSLVLAIGMIFLELVLITAVAIFFSSFTTPYLAGMFTVALWIIGHLLADLRAFGEHSEIASLQRLTEVLYWTLPNLDRLDIKAAAAAGRPLESMQLAVSALYAAGYSTMLLLASVVLFRRRDFR
jgi:hypothetical protein